MRQIRPIAVAGVALAAPLAPSAALASRQAERLYVALGDSYAYGLGASVPSQDGYVARLFRELQSPGRWRVGQLRNVAVPGTTTGSILDGQLDEALDAIRDPGTDTRVVTIQIGGNDVQGLPDCRDDPVACGLADRYTQLARYSSKGDRPSIARANKLLATTQPATG